MNISDGSNFIGQYCGNLTGKVILVSRDYLVLTFHSDGTFDPDKRGFEIFFAGDVNTPGKGIQKSNIPVIGIVKCQRGKILPMRV